MYDVSLTLSESITIDFYDHSPEWQSGDISNIFVYAEYQYNLKLCTTNDVKLVRIYINNENIGYFIKNKECFDFIYEKNSPIFLLYQGYVVFMMEITLDDDKNKILYSKYFCVINKDPLIQSNAETILNEIEKYNNSSIGNIVFNQFTESDNRNYSYWLGKLNYKSNRYWDSYLELLKEILFCYNNNFPFFKVKAYHRIEHTQKIVSYQKIRKMTQKDFMWLMKNTERFAQTNNHIGVKYKDNYLIPDYILSDEQYKNFNIYENKIVLSFLEKVLKNCSLVLSELEKNINNAKNFTSSNITNNTLPISLLTLKCLSKQHILTQLKKIKEEFQIIFSQYKKLWNAESINSFKLPKRTKIFQEISYYRDVYKVILKWFSFGEFSLIRENTMLKIKTMDTLYEYYCLYKMLEMFERNGWMYSNNIASKFFDYGGTNQDAELCNTFSLYKGNILLTFYYQPKIFGYKCCNDLSLFRTSKESEKESFWMPDFVFKFQQEKSINYIVLDSKYSNGRNIRKYLLPDVISKYINQMSSINNPHSIKALFLLQGKCNNNDKIENYNNSLYGINYYKGPVIKIIPLNIDSNITYLYNEIINAIQ